MFKNSKILVTGGAGFIGTNLVQRLVGLGATVRATTFERDPSFTHKSLEYFQGDLREAEFCKKIVEGMDLVFMCAANTSGAKVMATTPLVHLTPNVLMNMQMLEAAHAAHVKKFLFISSNTVYPLTDFAVKETDVTNEFYPTYHIVAWMKRFTEIVCEMYSNKIRNPMKTVVVRPGNLYGPFDKFDREKSKVIAALIRRAIEKQDPFIVWGDGKDIKDFLYIDDFIDGMLLAMEKLDGFQPINIASGVPIDIRTLLSLILRVAGHEKVQVQYDDTKPTMIPKRLIDVTMMKEQLGFSPKVSFEEGLTKTVNWYREYFKNRTPEDL